MLSLRAATAVSIAILMADAPTALRVIRTTPGPEAAPTAAITVTFDRPVVGSLDRVVDPASILAIEPAVAGTREWRDPVTLRLRPAAPLPAGTSYTVTVSPSFTALDGARLAEPFRFGFRVSGPAILAGVPVSQDQSPRFLVANQTFTLATSSPVDLADLGRLVYVEPGATCERRGIIRLTALEQRAIADSAPWQLREAGGWNRDRSADALRRVVILRLAEPLPLGCAADLVTPTFIDPTNPGPLRRWGFSTYGTFAVDTTTCGGGDGNCPAGPIRLRFTTPVRGADVLRHVRVLPKLTFTVADSTEVSETWTLWADLKPRTGYLIEVDQGLTDGFGQRLTGNTRRTVVTTGFSPNVSYPSGRMTVERNGPRTLPVTYVNVDTIEVIQAVVPESLEAKLLSRSWYAWNEDWGALETKATRRKYSVNPARDRHGVYGVPFANAPGLFAIKVVSRALPKGPAESQPIALIQVTDLGVHAKIGREEGVVWVTGVSDGKSRPGVSVKVRDSRRRLLAKGTTDALGIFRFSGIRRKGEPTAGNEPDYEGQAFEGYVEAQAGGDRALVGVTQYDPDLSPWQFNVSAAWDTDRFPMAAAVFTERGIYRPGDSVFAKAIVRTGALGALKVPARTDSVRIVFEDRDGGTLKERTVTLSPFGTAAPVFRLANDAPLGRYAVVTSLRREGAWKEVARADYKVAEYRAPEFLVDVTADTASRMTGDTLSATVSARYLFGAPMARAKVSWTVREQRIEAWDLHVPSTEGYFVADRGWWWEEWSGRSATTVGESRVDSLDGSGQLTLRAPLVLSNPKLPALVSVDAVVTDVNRQTVFGSATVTVHPTSYYIGAKPVSKTYFWTANTAERVAVIAVRPDGRRVAAVPVHGWLIRREWHQVRRESNGLAELVGEWVSDTVDRCAVRTGPAGSCQLTPKAAGSYIVAFDGADDHGRPVSTSFYRWVIGPGFVPWADESQFKMDVVPDRSRYAVGDTATVLFAAPFTNAEAWVLVEREGVIEQRRLTIVDGATTLKLPVTEAWVPNAFVSIVVARGRSAKPGPLDDPGRPTVRVGYAEVRVTPERKRLTVALAADRAEYRPGDQATVTARVTDGPKGVRSEVTLWAVDEGVLSLTGYQVPNPVELIYRPRGLGMRLGSNLSTVAPQVAPGDKGHNPGGGGGEGSADILRSRFRTTAFFLGSVVTDSGGTGRATVKLPDNLTTFRVMAVAVTAGDRYGSGQSSMLVTRPLVARAALPRFVRPGDQFTAGVVVNHRIGGTPNVDVSASAAGVRLVGEKAKSATLEAGRGREVRFDFRAEPGDSAAFRFDVAGAGDRDAVRLAIPIRPAFRARFATIAGVVTDSTRVALDVMPDADPARSRVTFNLGSSPAALLKGYAEDLRVYPYLCSEQVGSLALPIIALYRARKQAGPEAGDTVRLKAEIERTVSMLTRRQREDGAIGLWGARDWSSPSLTAHAGAVLLEAKAAGFAVRDTVIAAMAGYLTGALERQDNMALSVRLWDSDVRAGLAERVSVAEFLSRAGRRNRALENDLTRQLGQMAPDDRLQFAITLTRGGDARTARRILEPIWSTVKVEGRTAVLPDSARSRGYWSSANRTPALLLMATLLVDATHPVAAPLLETVVSRGRATGRNWWWNTQDYAMAARAVDAWQRRFPPTERRSLEVRVGNRLVFATAATTVLGDSTVSLAALLGGALPGPLTFDIRGVGTGAAGFFYLTLSETPRTVPVNPTDQGIQVERWYEDYQTGKPTTTATEGDLVRVRLRVTLPSERSFVVVDDPLPAGLEAIDLSLRTTGGQGGPGLDAPEGDAAEGDNESRWMFGSWDAGWWSPFDHRELRDDRVIYAARALWQGSYTATYLARATTPGRFLKPQAHAEEMYNPAVYGRSDGGIFEVKPKTR